MKIIKLFDDIGNPEIAEIESLQGTPFENVTISQKRKYDDGTILFVNVPRTATYWNISTWKKPWKTDKASWLYYISVDYKDLLFVIWKEDSGAKYRSYFLFNLENGEIKLTESRKI